MRRASRKSVRYLLEIVGKTVAVATFALGAALLFCAGCNRGQPPDSTMITATPVRAERRAFDGAPPVIPHAPLGASCTACHTLSGREVAGHGFAPANPHDGTKAAGRTANCRQCHLFIRETTTFVESEFAGLPQAIRLGDRLYPGAPPVIPHPLQLRENCQACHAGPSARPEIRCTHPERLNCRQCHAEQLTGKEFAGE